MRSWAEQCQEAVIATSVGQVTRGLLDRLIEQAPRPGAIRLHPSVLIEPDLQGMRLYADLLVVWDEECPRESVYIISDEREE